MANLKRDLRTIAIAVTVSALVFNAPALADGVRHALFAHNADKVDGIHAVTSAASASSRAGKLVATDGSGRLPNSIIAKAPAAALADRAKTADKIASVNALQGRPCTSGGQQGSTKLVFGQGTRNPFVNVQCIGVISPDGREPDNTRATAKDMPVLALPASGTLSPAGDVDWFDVSCNANASQSATNVVLSLARHDGTGTSAKLDGYRGEQTAPAVTDQSAWDVGTIAAGEHITVRVHGAQPDDYMVRVALTQSCY